MQEIHDRGYRKLFSNKEIFRQLVASFVKEKWVKELDFSECELVPGTFVSRKYKKTFSDLMYKVKWRRGELYIVILLEFKSAPDLFVAVQMLGYILDFYRHLIDSEKNLRKLPPVFPIMLYNGEKPWTAPLDISELIEGGNVLGEHTLHFKYFPIVECAYSKKKLTQIGNIVSLLFLAEAHYDFELLASQLVALFEKTEDKQAVSLFLNWLKQLAIHERIEEADYQKLERIYYDTKEVNMLITAIKEEKKQIREAGRVEGKMLQALDFARLMLKQGEPLAKIKRYTGLSQKALVKLQEELQTGSSTARRFK